MSRKGNCWDNAVAESFFATMEWELVEREDWHMRAMAKRDTAEYIGTWYNTQRRHSSLAYLCPAEYEARLAFTAKAA
jgi:transposase InsO family protein